MHHAGYKHPKVSASGVLGTSASGITAGIATGETEVSRTSFAYPDSPLGATRQPSATASGLRTAEEALARSTLASAYGKK